MWCRASTTAPTSRSSRRAAVLLDHEGRVAVADEDRRRGLVHGLGHQRRVVAADQVDRRGHRWPPPGRRRSPSRGPGRAHAASSTAARVSRPAGCRRRRGPARSGTRATPRGRPRPARRRAGRRSRGRGARRGTSCSRPTAAAGSRAPASAAEARSSVERLLGRLAQVEPGVEHDLVGRDPGGHGPRGPLDEEGPHVGHDVVVVGLGVGDPGGEADVGGHDGGAAAAAAAGR